MANKFMGRPTFLKSKLCRESKPRKNTIIFCGEFISLPALSFMTGITTGGLSYMFSGKYNPSLDSAKMISKALGMSLNQFVTALEEHVIAQNRYSPKTRKPRVLQTLQK